MFLLEYNDRKKRLLHSNNRDVSGNVSTAKRPKSIVLSPQSPVPSLQSSVLLPPEIRRNLPP